MREHRRVKKTPFRTNDGMNFSSEKGTLVLEAAKKHHCLVLLSSSLTKVDVCTTGAKIFYVYIQPREQQT